MDCGGGGPRPLWPSSAAAALSLATTLVTAAAAGAPERSRRRSAPRAGATAADTAVRMPPPARWGAGGPPAGTGSLSSAGACRAPHRTTPRGSRPLVPTTAAAAYARTRQRYCGNKEGASKYAAATLTIQKRRTQRVDLPRGPRRRKGAQGLGLERDAKISMASKTGRRGPSPAPKNKTETDEKERRNSNPGPE